MSHPEFQTAREQRAWLRGWWAGMGVGFMTCAATLALLGIAHA